MATNNVRIFDPQNSTRGKALLNATPQQLFERYFTKDNNVSWLKDFNTELNKEQPGDPNSYLYPYLVSLIGEALNFIPSYLHRKVNKYIPAGYKLNAGAVARDVEAILQENPNQTRMASTNNKANKFIVEVMEFCVERFNKGLDYKLGLAQD